MKIIIEVTMFVLLIVFGLSFWQYSANSEFRLWRYECSRDGGITVMTNEGFITRHWECLKDGKIINHVE